MHKILVIDDEARFTKLLTKLLSTLGEVHAAQDADSADKLIESHKFDVMVVDISMPGRSGIDFTRDARERGIEAPVIFYTAMPLPRVLSQINDDLPGLNCYAVIEKAGSLMLLKSKVADALTVATTEVREALNSMMRSLADVRVM